MRRTQISLTNENRRVLDAAHARLLIRDVKHFPMFAGLTAPY